MSMRLTPCLIALLAAFAVPTSAFAQEDKQAPAPLVDGVDARTLDRRRVLRLDDGRLIRGRAMFENGIWKQRVSKDWSALPEGSVVSQRLERELIAEARQHEAGIKRKDHSRRIGLAEWMVAQGLYPEAIGHLDRVLRAEPDHAGALRLIRQETIPLKLPDSAKDAASQLKETIKMGAAGTPATREIAIQRVADYGERLDLDKLIVAEMSTMQQKRRGFATQLARRLRPGEFLRELESRLMLDGSADVRLGAAQALHDSGDVAVIGPAITSLSSEHASVRANAAEGLGNLGFAAAVEPLVAHMAALQASGAPTGTRAHVFIGLQTAYVSDFNVEIAQGSSIADPVIAVQASGTMFDVRVSAVQMTGYLEQVTTSQSLQKLTGAKHNTAEGWAQWWEKNHAEWRSLDHSKKK